jgi:hypothetical protein
MSSAAAGLLVAAAVFGVSASAAAATDDAFAAVASVLQHPRCLNCHVPGDAPLQGDDGRPHAMRVRRGDDGRGGVAMRCASCHQASNATAPHAPPGAPNWHLPPARTPMVFQGAGLGELCRTLKDPKQNGGRTPARLLEHVREDALVLWGWDPGGDRKPPPLAHAAFVARFEEWVSAGAPCPK